MTSRGLLARQVVEITDALVVRENGEGDDLDRVSLNLSWLGIARIENLSRYRNIQTLSAFGALVFAVTTQFSAGRNSGTPWLYYSWLHQFGCTSVF